MALTRRRFAQGLVAGGALAAMPLRGNAAMGVDMVRHGRALLKSLSREGQSVALMPFTSPDRMDWHYTPRSRPGVPMGEMRPAARGHLRALLEMLFSPQGLEKLDGVIKLEKVLYDRAFLSSFRDPGNYAIVFFGAPDPDKAWAWRFEGHHLSVSVTVVPGLGVGATPAFFGANPQTVNGKHEHKGLTVLKAEERLAFQLIGGLDAKSKGSAIISGLEPDNIVAGPGREQSIQQLSGLSVAQMTSAQRGIVENLLNAYIGNMAPDIARRELARVRDAGWDNLRFGWAGALTPDNPHYYRLHAPTALIEYDNSQGGATHVHSVWHNPTNVFGGDMLKRHYAGGGH